MLDQFRTLLTLHLQHNEWYLSLDNVLVCSTFFHLAIHNSNMDLHTFHCDRSDNNDFRNVHPRRSLNAFHFRCDPKRWVFLDSSIWYKEIDKAVNNRNIRIHSTSPPIRSHLLFNLRKWSLHNIKSHFCCRLSSVCLHWCVSGIAKIMLAREGISRVHGESEEKVHSLSYLILNMAQIWI